MFRTSCPILLVTCLLVIGLLVAPPAHAQYGYPGYGGSWTVIPCNPDGTPIDFPQSSGGFYSLTGPVSGTVSNTYPQSMIQAAYANPGRDGIYLTAATPLQPQTPLTLTSSDSSVIGLLTSNGSSSSYSSSMVDAHNVLSDLTSAYYYLPNSQTGIPINGSVTSDFSGTLSYYFRWFWTGSGTPAAPMPTYMPLLLKTSVTADAAVGYGSLRVTSGLTAISVATNTWGEIAGPLTAQNPTDGPNHDGILSAQAGGLHLKRFPVDSRGLATVSVGGEASCFVNNPISYGPYSTRPFAGPTISVAGARASAGVRYDNRDVIIVCPTIEASYYKGPVDAQHPNGRWLHQRSADGAIETDSSVTRSGSQFAVSTSNYGDSFNAQAGAFSHPYYTWTVPAPGGTIGIYSQQYLGVENDQYVNLPLQILFGEKAVNFPKSTTINLKVRDNADGATGANIYAVKWHLPYEAIDPNPYLIEAGKRPLGPALAGPVFDGRILDVQATAAQHVDWDAKLDDVAAIAAAGGQEEIAGAVEIISAIAKVGKLATDVEAQSEVKNGAENGPVAWSDALNVNQEIYTGGNVPTDLVNVPNGWQLCKMYIYQMEHYVDKHWYADGYNSHGYDGNPHHVI